MEVVTGESSTAILESITSNKLLLSTFRFRVKAGGRGG